MKNGRYAIDTIYQGNCIDLIKELPDNSVDVTFTSPPYNRIRNDTYELYDDVLDDYLKMLTDITQEALRVTKRDVIINIQMILFNKVELCKWIGMFAEKMKGIIVWEKNNPQPATNFKGGVYSVTNAYEFFFVLSANGDMEFRANNKIRNVIHSNVNNEHFEGHGAVMRRDVAEWFVMNFTKEGEVILDPFMGMGTTGMVCALNKRHYIGFELVEEYKQRATERIANELSQITLFDYFGIENQKTFDSVCKM